MPDFRAQIEAILNADKAKAELDAIVNKPYKIDIEVTAKNLGNLSKGLSNITNQFKQQGSSAGSAFAQGLNGSLGNIKVDGISKQLGTLKSELQGLGLKNDSINAITTQLNNMNVAVTGVTTSLSKTGNLNLSIKGVDELGRSVTVITDSTGKLQNAIKTVATAEKQISFNNLQTAANNLETWVNTNKSSLQNFGTEIDNLRTRMQSMQQLGGSASAFKQWQTDFQLLQSEAKKLNSEIQNLASPSALNIAGNNFETWVNGSKVATEQFADKVQELRDRMQQMQQAGASSSAFTKWQTDLKVLQSEVKTTESELKNLANPSDLTVAGNNFTAWCNNNGKAVKAYGDEIKKLMEQMRQMQLNGATKGELGAWNKSVTVLQSTAKANGNIGNTLAQSFGSAYTQAIKFASAYVSIYRVFRVVKDGVNDVIALDDALVDLQKTASATKEELNGFYNEANDIAKQYGTSTKNIIQGAADWSRLGYNLEDSKTMSKLSAQFAAISPGMSTDKATESLVSTMKANLCLIA